MGSISNLSQVGRHTLGARASRPHSSEGSGFRLTPAIVILPTKLIQARGIEMIPAQEADWDELVSRFGYNPRRILLLVGLRAALESLKNAGCRTAYIDGSFVTYKEYPNDFDACWEEEGVDPLALDPVLLDLRPKRVAQKNKYYGELFPASVPADPQGLSFLEFFQTMGTGEPKGIVAIDLEGLT